MHFEFVELMELKMRSPEIYCKNNVLHQKRDIVKKLNTCVP